MKSKQRDFLIDNIKGFLIFLVVFGHGLEFLRKDSNIARLLYIYIYMFHMPAFVFISGYLSKNLEKGRNYAVRNLLVPFLFFNTLWNSLQLISFWIISSNISGRSSLFSFFRPGWALWYVLSMFLWRMFLPDIVKVKKAIYVFLILGLVSRLFVEFNVFMSLSRTIVFTPFFLAGYYTTKEKLYKFKRINKIFPLLMAIFIFILAILLLKYSNLPDEFLWADRSYNHFNFKLWQSIIFAILSYGIGFIFIFILSNLISSRKSFLSKVGENTLPVYLLHTYLISVLLGITSFIPNNFIKLIVIFIGSILTTFILSRDKVSYKFKAFLAALNNKISTKKSSN